MHGIEDSFERKSFQQLRPLAIGSEVIATVSCLFVLALTDVVYGIPTYLYSFCLLEGIATYFTCKVRNTQQLWLTGMVVVSACAACLGSLVNAVSNPMLWFLPIGLVISLPVSALHARPLHAFSIGIAIWATLVYVIRPHFERPLDLVLATILIVTSVILTLLVCITFCRIRKDLFDLQLQLRDMAYKDTLTGLPNRRAFMEQLEISRGSGPLFFLMLDIDDFKNINDSYGHSAGDLVLIDVAGILKQQSQGHLVARLGGEEFSVMAQMADIDAAQILAQDLVDAIHHRPLQGLDVSVSMGLAEREAGEPLSSLMRRADQALYQAKRTGKNRYALAARVAPGD